MEYGLTDRGRGLRLVIDALAARGGRLPADAAGPGGVKGAGTAKGAGRAGSGTPK